MPTPDDFNNVQLGGDNTFKSSSKMSGDPKELLEGSKECIEDHSSILEAYGLRQPQACLGQHPWLRDSLATPDDTEPGPAEPGKGMKVPFEDN